MEQLTDPYEMFLISSYYYSTSESLGNNSVALVLTADFESVRLDSVLLIAWNNESNILKNVKLQRITPHNVCRWISIFMTAETLPNLNKLALSLGNMYVEIPFKLPVRKKHEVVTCVAPLFANEQWQIAIFAAHTYRRSMVAPVFELLKEYEKENYLTIQPWLRIRLLTISEQRFNPNINIEFRNQAAAQTDCLLQYKESASYITFMDLDDVLLPRLGRTYFEEFTQLFFSMPNVAFLHYTKENVRVEGGQCILVQNCLYQLNPFDYRSYNSIYKLKSYFPKQ
uniref:Glycosyltransferase family 92 protein n=1 Tax=Heterorhabditis bacteriophora TaxID=37862 RepID=A0A1I7XHL3_HETBA